jgi:hypothetical protein
MDAFYAKINQLLTNVISKNEAVISAIEKVKEKCCQMLDELNTQNDNIIDQIQLFQQTATKEFKTLCASLVPKSELGDLEQRYTTSEQNANELRAGQTKYLKQIEDLEFEVKNLKSVSLLSQKDKYNRTLQIEVESLEKKLKAAEAKYKALEDRLTAQPTDVLVQTSAQVPLSINADAEPDDAEAEPEKPMDRCYARIGTDKIAVDTLTADEIAAYPSDVYKSKTGKFIGRPCTNLVSASGVVFCSEHAKGFSDIRAELPSDGAKPKKKKKTEAVEAHTSTAEASIDSAIASSETMSAPSVAEPSPSVAEPSPSVAEPSPSVAEPSPSVAEPSPSVAEPSPSVAEPIAEQPTKEKKPRKKKATVTTDETNNIAQNVDSQVDVPQSVEPTSNAETLSTPGEKVKKPRKKKTDTTVISASEVISGETQNVSEPVAPQADKTPNSQASTPGAKRGRKKKETPPTPTRTPITQKEHTLQKVEGNVKPSKPDWGFIEPWDAPDGTQYVVDTKTNYVFEATDTGDIGAFTGFMRV